jgi:hypothetical protein
MSTHDTDKTVLGKMETIKHIQRVRHFLYLMIEELDRRAREHDQSKLVSPEAEVFGEWTPELAKVEYDSPEYKALLEKVKPAIEHHYAKNRHHPEHWARGVEDMTLCDMVEMLCDWKAATERNKNGNIRTSIEKNTARYSLSPQLAQIMQNTVREMFQE